MKATVCLLLALAFIWDVRDVNCRDFTYMGRFGPDHWAEKYNTCNGKYQSPININSLDVQYLPLWPLGTFAFQRRPQSGQLSNNGHTVLVKLQFDHGEHPTIADGPLLDDKFKFSQLHFHWGENDTVGSEDRINNIAFPAELHVVFHNALYKTFDEAVQHSDGVAVLAFFFAIQEADNPNYAELTELLAEVRMPNTHVTLKVPPSLGDLITTNLTDYYTYTGSLTTPPCSEDVTWIDFATPIMISAQQIERFRQLLTEDGIPLTHNFRPIQPLNNRTIYKPVNRPPRIFNQPPPFHGIPFSDVPNAAIPTIPLVALHCHMLLAMTLGAMTMLAASL